MNTQRQTHQND